MQCVSKIEIAKSLFQLSLSRQCYKKSTTRENITIAPVPFRAPIVAFPIAPHMSRPHACHLQSVVMNYLLPNVARRAVTRQISKTRDNKNLLHTLAAFNNAQAISNNF
jgi:hypothetical protein